MSVGQLKRDNPYIFNSWRGLLYTEKGKKAGISDEWKDFLTFFNDVYPTYKKDLVLRRLDRTAPFSKENFIWVNKDEAVLLKDNLIKLNYNGEYLYLSELADKYNQSLAGIRLRYHRYKDTYTTEEIIFGRKKLKKKPTIDIKELDSEQLRRNKASKMLSAYRIKDKRKGFCCDITVDQMLSIMSQPCIYCGDTNRIGCDRIDNNRGHIVDNVVPCCVDCNKARNENFSFDEMKIIGKTIREIKQARLNKL